MWKESCPVMPGDPVTDYLMNRGLVYTPSPSLRYHASLYYREGDETGRYQAMLALVTAPDGSGASLHRTYLQGGKKAHVLKPKKLMPGLPLSGAAVRLFPVEPCLGIAEGIESAVGASMRFQMPVWSAISAGGVASFIPPAGVNEVVVFADNDESMVGQKAAYALASRLAGDGIKVRVEVPEVVGTDWADYL
jgi:putative DNA primase/helicase